MMGLQKKVKIKELREILIRAVVANRDLEEAASLVEHLVKALFESLRLNEDGEEAFCDEYEYRAGPSDELCDLLVESSEEAIRIWEQSYFSEYPQEVQDRLERWETYPLCLDERPQYLEKETLAEIARRTSADDKRHKSFFRIYRAYSLGGSMDGNEEQT